MNNDKELLKANIRAIVQDFSEFISIKSAAYMLDNKKAHTDLLLHEKKELMQIWTEEFVNQAADVMEEVS